MRTASKFAWFSQTQLCAQPADLQEGGKHTCCFLNALPCLRKCVSSSLRLFISASNSCAFVRRVWWRMPFTSRSEANSVEVTLRSPSGLAFILRSSTVFLCCSLVSNSDFIFEGLLQHLEVVSWAEQWGCLSPRRKPTREPCCRTSSSSQWKKCCLLHPPSWCHAEGNGATPCRGPHHAEGHAMQRATPCRGQRHPEVSCFDKRK